MMTLSSTAVYAAPAAVALGGLALGLLLERWVLPVIQRAAARSAWKYDDVLVSAIRGPIILWFVLAGLRIAFRMLPLDEQLEQVLSSGLMVVAVLSVTWAVARFTVGAMTASAKAGALPGVSLIANVTRVAVYAVGVLVILQTLGISITPALTALGVGGLAVGLALQDTLVNFFAGIRILASGRFHRGDFVRLDSGEEGFIEDITWAQTAIRQTVNSLVIVPNAKLSQAITINFSLPSPPQAVVIPVSVAYGSDLEKAELVTLEVAREVMQAISPRLLDDWEPLVRFHTFGDSGIAMNVILRAPAYQDRFTTMHAFVKRLHARYRQEGIEIPFPVRTVHLKGEASG